MTHLFKKVSCIIFTILVTFILSSCVNNRQIVYLQDKDYDIDYQYPSDSIIKSFKIESFQYRLKEGDIVSIEVSSLSPREYNVFARVDSQGQNPLLSGYIIDEEGAVELPVIGNVQISGLTVLEAQKTVQKEIDKYLEAPVVNLKMLNFNVTIIGEVNKPGTYTSYNYSQNVFDIIGLAGGMTDFADRDQVKLVRTKEGNTEIIYLNFLDDSLLSSKYYQALPNDVLIIPPMQVKNFRIYQLQYYALVLSTITVVSLLLLRI